MSYIIILFLVQSFIFIISFFSINKYTIIRCFIGKLVDIYWFVQYQYSIILNIYDKIIKRLSKVYLHHQIYNESFEFFYSRERLCFENFTVKPTLRVSHLGCGFCYILLKWELWIRWKFSCGLLWVFFLFLNCYLLFWDGLLGGVMFDRFAWMGSHLCYSETLIVTYI